MQRQIKVVPGQTEPVLRLPRHCLLLEIVADLDIQITEIEVVTDLVTAEEPGITMVEQLRGNTRTAHGKIAGVAEVVRPDPTIAVEDITQSGVQTDQGAVQMASPSSSRSCRRRLSPGSHTKASGPSYQPGTCAYRCSRSVAQIGLQWVPPG